MNVKFKIYTTILRPILIHGGECWTLSKNNEERLKIFERKILRKILGPVNEKGIWRLRYNDEIYNLYSEPNIVNIGRLRWIGHVMRMEEDNATRRLTLLRPDGGRRRGRPRYTREDGIKNILIKGEKAGMERDEGLGSR